MSNGAALRQTSPDLQPAPGSPPGSNPGCGAILAALPELLAEIAEGAAARERARELPFAAFERIRAARIGTLRVPAALGGAGASLPELIGVITALAAADSNVAHALRSHFNFSETLFAGPDAATSPHLPRLLAGELYGGAATETGTARPGEITTQLVPEAGGWRLNGRKFYATGTAYCDHISTSALDPGGQAVRLLLPLSRPGIQVLDDWDGMGQRLTASGSVVFTDVAVRPDEITRAAPGSQAARHAATFRQLFLSACIGGILRNLLSDARAYIRDQARPITHSPAAQAREDPFVQARIGSIAAASHAVDRLNHDAALQLDRTRDALLAQDPGLDTLLTENALTVARVQVVVGPLALQAAERIFDTGGAGATSAARNFDRHWRNIRTILSHNPLYYKEQVIGAALVNDSPLPLDGGFF